MRIALMGISGSGKDHCANILSDKFGFARVSFSDGIKKIACNVFPWLEKDYPAYEKEQPLNIVTEYGDTITMSPREIWNKMDVFRQIDPHAIVRIFKQNVDLSVENLMISDIRMFKENDWCTDNNFYRILIRPTEIIYSDNPKDEEVKLMIEKGMYDFVVENDLKTDPTDQFVSIFEQIKLIEQRKGV